MLGHRKNKWTPEEEEALVAGIAKYGPGKWSNIIEDPEFAPQLLERTNINLKDKWRNMKTRVGSMEKSRTQTIKSVSVSFTPAKTSPSNKSSPSSLSDMSNATSYCPIIFEAISTINDESGSDLKEILSFIEERQEVPKNFKKLLSNSLRLLVSQDKLKKVRNHYKISITKATKPAHILHPKDSTNPPELPSTSVMSTKTKETHDIDAAANKVAEGFDVGYEERQDFRKFLSECLKILVSQGKLEKVLDRYKMSELEKKVLEAAPEVVAMKLAESDNKRLIAAEAVEEEQRMHKFVEESHTMLQLSIEIHKQCALGEEVVLR
ncbi:hypothetical protein CARUB_v10009763mg [Capsella rubella]|uniref:MYB transcription factor n=1 Tax=Capsella rubella TaxID=81985 RepID=R0GQR3_9BRAS|nr:telomere repeat-binding factor 5 isoform X2 [Capsella rubella]EOA38272.1 hypothetical protein CARUB_v10009763mg [Capsella rubella]